jgi:hypothetical protein
VEAALNPAKGDWQFFVATNPDTGETKFANTYDEHQKNVEIYRKWLKEHNGTAARSEDPRRGARAADRHSKSPLLHRSRLRRPRPDDERVLASRPRCR